MTVYANLNLGASAWLEVPSFKVHPAVASPEAWAARVSQNTWADSRLPHEPLDVERLAAVLATCAQKWGPDASHPERAADPDLEIIAAIHVPDPRTIPFPARVMVADAEMVTSEKLSLRDLVEADDLRAITAPKVEEIENPNLGTGLVAYRLRPMETEPGQPKDYEHPVYGLIRYAFPVPGHDDKILVTVSWPDIGRLAAAREDLDNLARGLTFEYHPDESGA